MGLFSTTHVHNHSHSSTPYCREVNVTEKRAPTDESVRLLNEMQEKAKDNIIKTITISGNNIEAVVVFMRNEMCMDKYTCYLRFTLNGKEHKVTAEVDRREFNAEHRYGGESSKVMLYKAFSEALAIYFMREVQQ